MISTMRGLGAKLSYPLAERYTKRHIRQKKARLDAWLAEDSKKRAHRLHLALCDVVQYAEKYVPYYHDLFRRTRFNPERLRNDVHYWQDIPFLTKETILANPERLLSTEFPRDALAERKTSGSTGSTLSFYYSKEDLDWVSATVALMNEAISRRLSDREAHLVYVDNNTKRAGFLGRMREKAKLAIVNRSNINIRDLSLESVRLYLHTIKQQKPYLLYGLQSTLKALIQVSQNESDCHGLCEYFVSSGETLDTRSTQIIRDAVGCSVVNRYGNAEFGAVAQSVDNPQELRIIDGTVFPENFVIQGCSEIVLTTLVGRAMPLIRYRTGDLGVVEKLHDGTYMVSKIVGRVHDTVSFGGSTFTTSYIATCLHAQFRIHDFQIVQYGEHLPEFRIVTDYPEQLPDIEKSLGTMVGIPVKVKRIRPADIIRKGRQMKFAYYVRETTEM